MMAASISTLHAQTSSTNRPSSITISEGKLIGQIVDNQGKPIAQASVNLLHVLKDQNSGKEREVLIRSTSSQENGTFSFSNVSIQDKWKLKISSVGYTAKDILVEYGSNNKNIEKDMGSIVLESDNQKLDEVTVTGRKALLEMDIDKKCTM